MEEMIRTRIEESIRTKSRILEDPALVGMIEKSADAIVDSIGAGHKLVLCGNGGSASDALHFAGEIVGRFQRERNPWPAVVLNADAATMTAIANDYSYDEMFARQARAHVCKDDVFVGISTSGNSENVYRALLTAEEKGAKTVALLGRDGGKIGIKADFAIVVPSDVTARIQESHIMIIHILCELAEMRLCEEIGNCEIQ